VAAFGLTPAMLATGLGSDVQRPLATVVVFGLISATALTLLMLPALYQLIEARVEAAALSGAQKPAQTADDASDEAGSST